MSQRPQRAAAAQAIKANTAALAPRRRSDSQASIKTITSSQHSKTEDRRYDGRSSPSMDVVMQRSSHQDLRGRVEGSMPAASHDEGAYASNMQVYWPDDGSMGPVQAGSVSAGYAQQLWDEPHAEQHSLSHYDQVPSHGLFDLHYSYSTQQGNSLGLKAESGLNAGLQGNLDMSGERGERGERGQRDQRFDASTSDAMALLDNLPFKANSSADNDSYEDSTDSDLPPAKKKLSAAFRPRGRKKRNKCTPDQLRSLEAFFEKNRNPTGRIRLELSRRLRMPERSVQVWFQNRRAKLKTVERRGDTSDSSRKKSCSIRLNDKDAHKAGANRMARDATDQTPSVTAIPTSALCIGTWRRVSPLICFFSRRLQSLTWYLTSESIGFKLEIPWTSIRSAYFDGPSNPSIAERAEGVRVPLGHFVIDLERPPTFFMEVFRSAPLTGKNGVAEEPKVSWRQCEDFTEDHQAMTVSRHVLNGPYEELRSAVQALAKCNDVLERLIKFHDEDQRAAGAIPTGSGSTADNFGLVTNVGGPEPFPPPGLDACNALVDAYGNAVHMPMQPPAVSASNMKNAVWHNFRTPLRGEHPWEFDSPASVSTNLSEASLDSSRHAAMGYSPYGVPTSIEASPRSGLGSSMDLNTLRIDTGGISSFGSAAGASVPMMGEGGAMDGTRSFGWEGRLGYEMQGGHHEEQYSLAQSGVMEAGQMQAGMENGLNMQFHRSGERQDYHAQGGHNEGLLQASEPKVESSQLQEARRGSTFNTKEAPHDHLAEESTLLVSRRFSHADTTHVATPREATESELASRRDHKVAFSSHLGPASIAPSGNGGKMTSIEEDAFSGKTPTHRTCFGSTLQLSQANEGLHTSSLVPAASGYESDKEGAAQGRARSNTYRPSMHGGGGGGRVGVASPLHRSEGTGHGQSPVDGEGSGSADGMGSPVDDAEPARSDDEKGCGDGGKMAESGVSPGLLSSADGTKRDASPSPAGEKRLNDDAVEKHE